MITVGLAVKSTDCRYTFALKLSPYYDWIESKVFPAAKEEKLSSVYFVDRDFRPEDDCVRSNGGPGKCKDVRECNNNLLSEMTILCKEGTVCC